MRDVIRFSVFIFILYYVCFLLIQITGINYELYFMTSFLGYPSYILTFIITSACVFIYTHIYCEDCSHAIVVGLLILVYSIVEFRYGIIIFPIYIVMINIIYSISLITGVVGFRIYNYLSA